jgi:ParB-like chromosome segregation protein Spo0J
MIDLPPPPATPAAEHPASLPLLIDPRTSDESGHQRDVVSAPVVADVMHITVPIDQVAPSRYRVRHPSTPQTLAPLIRSLRTPGRVLAPCPAILGDDDATFEILDGHRLVEAGRALGWAEIPLMLMNVNEIQAALWVLFGDSHRHRRYTWWEKRTAMRVLSAIGADQMTGREIAHLSGWSESTVSEARKAAAILTPDILLLAGVDESRDRDQLVKLRRRDGRYIVRGGPPEEIAVRLREALDGRTPEGLAEREARERAAGAISSALHTDGRWRVEVDLGDLTGADLRALRRELVRQFDDACAKGRRAPAGRRVAPVKQVTTPPSASAVQVDRGVPVATHAVSLPEMEYCEPAPQPPTTDDLG